MQITDNKHIDNKAGELSFILNNISHAVLFESLQNEIIFINQNFCDLFNIPVSPELLFGADCSKAAEQSADLFKDPEKFVEGIRKIYREEKAVHNEELFFADGRSVYRDYKPLLDHPVYNGHLWIYKNTSELRSILNEVQEQKNFYEHLLNNIPADIAIFDKDHKYTFLNKVALSKKDARHWLLGKDDFDYCREMKQPMYLAVSRRALFTEAIQTGEMIEFEESKLGPDGKKVHNLRRFYPLKNQDGTIDKVIGYGINITRIREREERLIEQEQALRDLVDSMGQMVVVINESGNIAYANPQWGLLTGLNSTKYLDKKLSMFIKKGRDSFLTNVQLFFSKTDRKPKPAHVCITSHQGKNHTLSYYISNFNTGYTGEKRVAVFFNDITEQLVAEKKLKKIAREERNLSELKSSFMSLVSHELRTPLSVILSSAELIELTKQFGKGTSGQDDTMLYTNRIIHQVDKMTQLMNEFLFLSKAESGKIPFNPVKLDVYALAEKLKKELYSPSQDMRTLALSVRGAVKPAQADELMISHILSNLVNNAFKYSEGKPAPMLRIIFAHKYWEILLLDFGIGVSVSEKKKIFQPFTRGTNVGAIEGTGFGLMVVNFFVKMHKGKIHLKSIEGKGTAVSIQFPYDVIK